MALRGNHIRCELVDCSVDGEHCEECGEAWPCWHVAEPIVRPALRGFPGSMLRKT